jgi:hypothetical protein
MRPTRRRALDLANLPPPKPQIRGITGVVALETVRRVCQHRCDGLITGPDKAPAILDLGPLG